MSREQPRLVVAAALVDRLPVPTRVLAARRTGPPGLAGQWELPGGKVEPGEQPLAALHREMREELDVRISVGPELVPTHGTAWPVSPGFVMRVWWCVSSDRPTISAGHDALAWVDRHSIAGLPWLAGDAAIVARLANELV